MLLTTESILNTPAEEKRQFFESTLLATNRPGIQNVIEYIQKTDFYIAPSSTKYHSNYDGGLLDHSLLVYTMIKKLREDIIEVRPNISDNLTDDSIAISSLLHDICKSNFYYKTTVRKCGEDGRWRDAIGYKVNDKFPFGHGEKSVAILLGCGLQLTYDEMLAIRWHMGNWEASQMTAESQAAYRNSMNNVLLVSLLSNADTISTNMLESIYEY